jgi:Uri superfamily endonuclease
VLAAGKRQVISVGRLGTFDVRPGFYVYVGSALGSGGLAARIGRHLRQEKTLRWHVDYLRAVTELVEVWFRPGRQRRECLWAERLARMPGAGIRRLGFGSSDCGCRSHLIWFEVQPVLTIAGIEVWRCDVRRP